MYLGALTV